MTILGGAARKHVRLSLLVAGLACLALFAPGARAAATEPLAIGVNIANAPDQLAPLQQYESLAGRNPAMVMWYQQWSEPLYYSDQEANTKAIGAIPLITWDPDYNGAGIPLSQIVAGDYDQVIVAAAQAAKAWGGPMYIRLMHEMNISASLYGPGHNGNTAAEFVAAWKHVVTIFRQQGADNVEWVWSPNVYCGGECPFTAYYPGDQWVDWVALDGYNYSSVDDDPWMTFAQIFGPSYSILTSLTSKPMMIGETASAEAGGNKAQWISQMFSEIPTTYSRIHAVVWFDRVKETDWTIDSSAATLAAWKTAVAAPGDQGTATTLEAEAPFSSSVTNATSGSQTATSGEVGSSSSSGPNEGLGTSQSTATKATTEAQTPTTTETGTSDRATAASASTKASGPRAVTAKAKKAKAKKSRKHTKRKTERRHHRKRRR